jgi:hypothetical protein
MKYTKFSISVGLLLRSQIRNELWRVKYSEGKNIDYVENKRFLGSDFVISGDSEYVSRIYNYLKEIFGEE